jgi:hypothetical protein
LFKLVVPSTTLATSSSVQISRETAAAAAAAAQTGIEDGFNGILGDVADNLNDTADNVMVPDAGAVTSRHGHDVADVRKENADALGVVDWTTTPTVDVPSLVNGQLGVELDSNWNKLTTSLSNASKDREQFDGCLLAESVEDEDVSDYSLVFDPSADIIRSVTARRAGGNVDQLICDDGDDDDDAGRRLLDPFGCAINDDCYDTSAAVGSSDTMWCGGQSTWTPDNDLGGLLIFGPN